MQRVVAIVLSLSVLIRLTAFAQDSTKRVLYVGLPQGVELYDKPSFKWDVESHRLRPGIPVTVIPANVSAPLDTFETKDGIRLPGEWLMVYTDYDTGYVFDALFLPFEMESYDDVYINKRDICEPPELSFFEYVFGVGDTKLTNVKAFDNTVKYFKTKKATSQYCVQRFTKQLGKGFTFHYSRPADRQYAPLCRLETSTYSLTQMYCIATMFAHALTYRGIHFLGSKIYSDYVGDTYEDCYNTTIRQIGNKVVWEFCYYCE